jgi:hypothetical protein
VRFDSRTPDAFPKLKHIYRHIKAIHASAELAHECLVIGLGAAPTIAAVA